MRINGSNRDRRMPQLFLYRFKTRPIIQSMGGMTVMQIMRSEESSVVYQEANLIDDIKEIEPQPNWEDLIGMLADKISPSRLQSMDGVQSPIQNWRELEEASQKGWLLTTKQVHELAGAKPKGQQWQRGAFTFSKAGKIGNQAAWLVEKL